MNKKIISFVKLILGLLLVIAGFTPLINSFFVIVRGFLHGSDSFRLGEEVGFFFGSLIPFVIGLWLLGSWYKHRELAKKKNVRSNINFL